MTCRNESLHYINKILFYAESTDVVNTLKAKMYFHLYLTDGSRIFNLLGFSVFSGNQRESQNSFSSHLTSTSIMHRSYERPISLYFK